MVGKRHGNSLPEYILPTAIIAVAVIVMLPTLGDNLKTAIVNTHTGSTLDQKNLTLQPFGKMAQEPVLANDSISDFPQSAEYLSRFRQSIETIGGNGTTTQLLEALQAYTRRLLAEGTITPEQANQLEALANKGYRLATLERLVEEAAANASDQESYFKSRVVFEGKSYTIVQATAMLMANQETRDTTDIYGQIGNLPSELVETFQLDPNNTSIGRPLMEFIETYREVQQSGALNVPEVRDIVLGLSRDVKSISLNLSGVSTGVYLSRTLSPQDVGREQASRFSRADSAGICTTGGTTSRNDFCPKS